MTFNDRQESESTSNAPTKSRHRRCYRLAREAAGGEEENDRPAVLPAHDLRPRELIAGTKAETKRRGLVIEIDALAKLCYLLDHLDQHKSLKRYENRQKNHHYDERPDRDASGSRKAHWPAPRSLRRWPTINMAVDATPSQR